MVTTKYYHGGPRGRKRGSLILPPSITGKVSTADIMQSAVCDKSKVYITTEYSAALLYAGCHRDGVVYLVDPIGDLEHDKDCDSPGLSFCCEKARVKRIIKPNQMDLEMARRVLLS